MRTINTIVYQYAELSDKAKENARDWFRQFVFTDSNDWDYVYDDALTIAALMGITIDTQPVKLMGGGTAYKPVIYFSGFSYQGDGASFAGRYNYKPDAVKAVKEHAPTDETLHGIADSLEALHAHVGELSARITTSGRSVHSGSMRAEVSTSDGDDVESGIEHDLLDIMRSFADWIYSQLEREYEYQNSDEVIAENIEANEYEFTENGSRARC